MASANPTHSSSGSADENIMWEYSDDYKGFDIHSDIDSPMTSAPISPTSSQLPTSSQPTTLGLTSLLTTMSIASQGTFFPVSSSTPIRKSGRPFKVKQCFHGNQFNFSSQDTPIEQFYPPLKRKQPALKISKRGYCSQFSNPKQSKRRFVDFKTTEGTNSKRATVPTGMRIIDVEKLAEVITKLRCTDCSRPLTFFEIESVHGWQTSFAIKCTNCHQLFAELPTSKPMEEPSRATFVNVSHPERVMNEVTIRSSLAVHSSGFSWRDLYKFPIIFGMPAPLSQMPPQYLNEIDNIVQNATQTSMTAAADELHLKVAAIPSPVPNCTNIPVSIDSSWKTRGF